MFDVIKTFYALKTLHRNTHTPSEIKLGARVFKWNNPVYLFSNENISAYLQGLDNMRGGRVLAVGASGDHALESLLMGARHVDTFDINYLQRHVLELKTKMISHLPHADFVEYFLADDQKMNQQIIRPIWRKFSPSLRLFLRSIQRPNGMGIFSHSFDWCDANASPVRYVSDAGAYDELQSILRHNSNQITFHENDLLHVPAVFHEKFDVILLSNIFTYYAPAQMPISQMKTFYNNILVPLSKLNMGKQGSICFNYMWTSPFYNHWKNDFSRLFINREMIDSMTISPHHSFELIEVPSVLKALVQDCAFVMHHHVR